MTVKFNITVLVAPLDWGLGHATRCIPIINQLLASGCKVIIAADGIQEKLLKKEFPELPFARLPGYCVKYTSNKRFFALKIIIQIPKILKAIKREQLWLQNVINENKIDVIISDNRYGLFNSIIPSIFVTHQLLIKAPVRIVEKWMQKINYKLIEKFSECWVPDMAGKETLAGELSHPTRLPKIPVKYLGGLSRLEKAGSLSLSYEILILISGPEPQRTLFENKVLQELKNIHKKTLLVRGLPQEETRLEGNEYVTIVNHLPGNELARAINESGLIISRSGYTTVMDICKLQKKAVLIPTPGQTEQEYLAKHLQEQRWCLAGSQDNLSLSELLQKSESFDYNLPELNMEAYKNVIDEFLKILVEPK